jgi:hypothetical protein
MCCLGPGCNDSEWKQVDRMRVRVSMSWDVRVAVAVLLAWFAWALVWFVWAARDAGLRSADAHIGFMVYLVMVAIAAAVCVGVANHSPGWGEVACGVTLTAIGLAATVWAADQLLHWGEIVDPTPDRIVPWKPWDSLAALPFTLVLPAGLVLVVGGIKHVYDETHGLTRAGRGGPP